MNFCSDNEEQLNELLRQRDALAEMLAASERNRRIGRAYVTADMGEDVILPGEDGVARTINTADLDRGIQQIAEGIDDPEIDDYIKGALGGTIGRRPKIGEGKWQNYDRILREVAVEEREDYAKLAELLGLAHRTIAPKDYAFVTKKYGMNEMPRIIADAMGDLEVTAPEVAARIASDAAGFVGLVERLTRVRLFADRSKYLFLDDVDAITGFMEKNPDVEVPARLKEAAFNSYTLALLGERHFAFARRRTAQSLKSLQEPILSGRWFEMQGGKPFLNMVGQDAADAADVSSVVPAPARPVGDNIPGDAPPAQAVGDTPPASPGPGRPAGDAPPGGTPSAQVAGDTPSASPGPEGPVGDAPPGGTPSGQAVGDTTPASPGPEGPVGDAAPRGASSGRAVGDAAPGGGRGADDLPDAEEILTLTPKDIDIDSFIGKIISLVDEGAKGLPKIREMVDTAIVEGLDPKRAKLEEGWFNATMRRGVAVSKESQLSSLRTQAMAGEVPNVVMMLYGPLQKTLKDGMRMVPAGTNSLKRLGLLEAAKSNAKAYMYAWHQTRYNLKEVLANAYMEGITRYGGNPDSYGSKMSSNAEVKANLQMTLDQPWSRRNYLANLAMAGPKLNAAVRLNLKKLHQDIPLQPIFRLMGAFDEAHGKFNYMFSLMSDLQVDSRARAAELGLDTEAKRQAWVEQELRRAVYSASPTEEDVIAFRKQMRLGPAPSAGGEPVNALVWNADNALAQYRISRRADGRMTDDEVIDIMTKSNIAGSPTFSTPYSLRAFNFANEMRFQNKPQPELITGIGGGERGLIGAIDESVTEARRKNWVLDLAVPYWRAPMNALLFDFRLAASPLYDPFKMVVLATQGKAGTEEMRHVASRWVISMGLLGGFAALREAGQITGGNHPDPAKRNRIFGIPYLGGIPILSSLFLWSDVFDQLDGKGATDAEGNEAMAGILQIITAQIMRGTGIQQLQQIVSAIMDRDIDATRSLVNFGGFLARGHFVPFSGALGTLERLGGLDAQAQFMGGNDTNSIRYHQGVAGVEVDGPFKEVEKRLREFAYAAVPGSAGLLARNLREFDWLGSQRGIIAGIDMARAIPLFFPGVWPNDPIYAELEALDQLDPPTWVRRGTLDGVGMSGALQKKAVGILGSIKGESLLASFGMAGETVKLRVPLPQTFVARSGVRIAADGAAEIDLAPFLEPHVKGRKMADAFRSLFNSPLYRAMEASKAFSSDPTVNRGIPSAERRRQPAQQMVRAIKRYYTELTRNELERLAQGGDQDAMEWSMAKTKAIEGKAARGQEMIKSLPQIFGRQ